MRIIACWKLHIASHPHFNPDCECLAVLLLNTRRKVKGHHLVSIGTMDTLLVHAREVFRVTIVTAASGVIVMHNHPSGESSPSDADMKTKAARQLVRRSFNEGGSASRRATAGSSEREKLRSHSVLRLAGQLYWLNRTLMPAVTASPSSLCVFAPSRLRVKFQLLAFYF
jgi:hypothetical protein